MSDDVFDALLRKFRVHAAIAPAGVALMLSREQALALARIIEQRALAAEAVETADRVRVALAALEASRRQQLAMERKLMLWTASGVAAVLLWDLMRDLVALAAGVI